MTKPIKTPKQLPRISALVRDWAKSQNTSLRKLSLQMRKSESYLHKNLRSNDIRPSLLISLSGWLNVNLFEYYLELLPLHVRPTAREKELMQEMETLKKELKRVEEERDRYWEVISKQPVSNR